MRKKTAILLSVGCGGVLVIFGIIVVSLGYKLYEFVNDITVAEQARQQLANNWQPPANGASLEFPAKVANYDLISQDEDAAIPALGIDIDGQHALYQMSKSRVDIFVYRANELEKEALFRRVEDVFDEEFAVKVKSTTGHRLYCSTPTHGHNHFWWIKGWLFCSHTPNDSEDSEPFISSFLKATSAQ